MLGEPGHRRSQRFGHRIDAGPSSAGCVAVLPVRRQRELTGGKKVLQGARQRTVGVDRFQQSL
jgi:hypothetical protein